MSARHPPGAIAIAASSSMPTRSTPRKTRIDHRISFGTGTTSRTPATSRPSASPSRTRSTTTVANVVQNRGPWRDAT